MLMAIFSQQTVEMAVILIELILKWNNTFGLN